MFQSTPFSPAAEALKKEILSIPVTAEALTDDLADGPSSMEMEILHDAITSRSSRVVGDLKKLITRYPDCPTLMNYLMVAYQMRNQRRQQDQVLRDLARIHPDYLFTRVGLALKALETNQLDQAAEALGPDLDIRSLYPERPLFHITELRNYYICVAILHARRHMTDLSHGVRAALEEIEPGSEASCHIIREVIQANALALKERMRRDDEMRIEVRIPPRSRIITTTLAPKFHHPEISAIYDWDIELPAAAIQEILALPRETLIADLIRAMDDAIVRTPNFMAGEVEEQGTCAPVHALHFLAELHATEAIESLLRFLSLHPEALQFWCRDLKYCPQIARIIKDSLPRVTAWLKSPGISSPGKIHVAEAMGFLARTDSARMKEVASSFEEILALLLESPREDNLLDTHFLSMLVNCAIDLRCTRLLPWIEQAWEKGYIEEFLIGDLESITRDLTSAPDPKPQYLPVAAQYRQYLKANDPDPSPGIFGRDEAPYGNLPAPPATSKTNVGRNDPCPCGSGRKYKKCCMGKA